MHPRRLLLTCLFPLLGLRQSHTTSHVRQPDQRQMEVPRERQPSALRAPSHVRRSGRTRSEVSADRPTNGIVWRLIAHRQLVTYTTTGNQFG